MIKAINKKIAILILSTLVAGSALTGCGNKDAKAAKDETSDSMQAQETAAESSDKENSTSEGDGSTASDSEVSESDNKESEGASTFDDDANSDGESDGRPDISALPETCEPAGIVADDDGNLYITDTFSKVIWKVTEEGAEVYAGTDSVEDIYGEPLGGYNDAVKEEALFREPWGIAPFLDGYAVSDVENDALRYFNTEEVETLNAKNEKGVRSKYNYPTGLVSDADGNLYVSNTHSDEIKVISPEGKEKLFAKDLNSPMGIAIYDDYMYVAETGENRIVKISMTGDDRKAEVVAGSGEAGMDDGAAAEATFSSPKGLAIATDGTIYVADTINGAVRVIKDGQVSTMEQPAEVEAEGWNIAPIGLCVVDDSLYVCENFSHKVYVISLK